MPKFIKSIATGRALIAATIFGMHGRPVCFWDVGARWGLSRPMECLYRAGVLRPVFFEPDRDEAARLTMRYRRSTVFNYALSDNCRDDAPLYVMRDPGSSSLLRPVDQQNIIKTVTVPAIRADKLTINMQPDVVKLDVQGLELAALKGFGKLLDHLTCVEAEVSFVRIYENQPLSDELVAYMSEQGFGLFDIRVFGVRNTRSAQQANAFFIRREIRTKREERIEKVFRALHGIGLPA